VIVAGSRRGTAFPLDRGALTIGRGRDADIRFDPEIDLVVSGRHATIERAPDGSWIVRDLASTNGTFVNGLRVMGEMSLSPLDRITLGSDGPTLEFRVVAPVGATATAPVAHAGSSSPPTVSVRVTGGSVTSRSATGRRNVLTAGVAVVVLVGVGITAYALRSRSAAWEGERALLQQRIDSLTTAGEVSVQSLQSEVLELTDALRDSQDRVREASVRLEQAEQRGDPAEVALLRGQLDSATAALGQRQAAAALDFSAIQRSNRPAVAMIFVEGPDGGVSTGTAFAVRPDATLLTSRHVVAGADGTMRPRRIAIQFSDSDQIWPARVLGIAEASDLAVVKVDNIIGEVPTIRSFNLGTDTLSAGGVVASIGFPVGRGLTAEASYGRGGVVEPLLSAGIISRVTPGQIEFQGYGSAGASGSPVFDATGSLIAILFGGLSDSTHPTLLGVPTSAAIELLDSLPD
jgi:S1-C subfamily serine protease